MRKKIHIQNSEIIATQIWQEIENSEQFTK